MPSTQFRHFLIGDIFRQNAAIVPEGLAAALGGESLSHAELDARGNRLAHALRGLGIGHLDRVACWADTCLEVLPLFAACAKLGAVFAPVNARLGPAEALQPVELARPALLVADGERLAGAAELAGQTGAPLACLHGPPGGGGLDLAAAAVRGPAADLSEPALREGDPHVIFFTSGSTGKPKGVVLSHRANWLRSFQGPFRDDPERGVCMFPLYHMAGFSLALSAWQTRGSIALVHSPTPEALLSAVQSTRANRLYCIPLVWSRILASDTGRYDLSSLRELDTGTSAVPIELLRALKERFPGTRTRTYYGSTEAGSCSTLSDADALRKPGSVGLAAPAAALRISAEGEICVRSPYMMDGYFENPEATAEALRDGWYHTGDLGALDEEGYLQVTGRMREVIRSGGESVSPLEVEAALAGAAGVRELAVIGVPDADWGELVCAVVVPEPGAKVTLEALQAVCEGRIAGFKKPRRIAFAEALPRTAATGQVQRGLLAEQLAQARAGAAQ
ncbi:MAG: class I adenylate-forming enzyme family protein [Deltaproteobacteria bacterium]|nr:class I adenylate-forming enzyme family protein [Deltaproteobacteria bacterium]